VSTGEATRLLQELTFLTPKKYVCCGRCHERLDDTAAEESCPHSECGVSFEDVAPVTNFRYELHRQPPRDVSWVLVLHGMNTLGTWQEELSWLISRMYKHMVPVAIYKYGNIRQGVIFHLRQRQLMRKLIAKIKVLSGQSADAGYGGIPDVIAHSFGTWLIAHALRHDKDLHIGRLILLGSIVRPDFEWESLIRLGRVEAVLNHGATADEWVPFAQFFIPDAGPGGRRGYPPPVKNIRAEGLRHSDYFNPEERMRSLFRTVWEKFLSWVNVPPIEGEFVPPPWKPVPALFRFLTWLLGTTAFWTIVAVVIAIIVFGINDIF
jgi:hypothetical protein